MKIVQNASLKKYNSFGVEMLTNKLYHLHNDYEIEEILDDIAKNRIKYFVLGEGSNILFTSDYRGGIIRNELKGISIIEDTEEYSIVQAKAGEKWDSLVQFTTEHRLWGIENLSLIPGTVGAAPVQNIGAYGQEVKDSIVRVIGFDTFENEWKIFNKMECLFGYRESIFKTTLKNRIIITSVDFKLSKKFNPKLNYGAIQQHIGTSKELTPQIIRDAIIKIRKEKLPDPEILGNAGSFFKNPIINTDQFDELVKNYPDIVSYPDKENKVKIPAGWLIEKCGYKGKIHGRVGTYEKQALVIVNHGGATGREIFTFAKEIQKAVMEKFAITLEFEVSIL